MRLVPRLLFAFARCLAACAGVPAWACSCIGNPACTLVKAHDAMFLGKVLTVRTEQRELPPMGYPIHRRIFTIEVSETFAGGFQPGDKLEVETGVGGGDCGYGFRIGESYLVDAYRGQTGLQTGICTATAPETAALNTMRELRSAAAGAAIPDLSGFIQRSEPGKAPQTLANIGITLTAADGSVQRTLTDAAGTYTFADLPAGNYMLHALLPEDLATYEDSRNKPQVVTISPRAERQATCHVNVIARPRNEIVGTVTDDARPAAYRIGRSLLHQSAMEMECHADGVDRP